MGRNSTQFRLKNRPNPRKNRLNGGSSFHTLRWWERIPKKRCHPLNLYVSALCASSPGPLLLSQSSPLVEWQERLPLGHLKWHTHGTQSKSGPSSIDTPRACMFEVFRDPSRGGGGIPRLYPIKAPRPNNILGVIFEGVTLSRRLLINVYYRKRQFVHEILVHYFCVP